MGSDPTALTVSLPAGNERVYLQWTNPTTTFDTTRVSSALSGSGSWTVQYQGNPLAALYCYPLTGVAMDYKVEALASGVLSNPTTVTDITLPVYCDDWGIFLSDVSDPTVHAEIGLYKSYTGMQQQTMSAVKSYIPMGATYPKDFPSRVHYRQWKNSFDLAIPLSVVLTDGTVVSNQPLMANLRTMAPPRLGLTLWRDARGLQTYVKILDYKEWPAADGGWTVEMVVEERQPPTYPFTATS